MQPVREAPPFDVLPAWGRHEVVVHVPRHAVSLAELEDDEIGAVATTWASRARAARDVGFAAVFAFVNEGRPAGASRAHAHSQLIWLAEPPPAVVETATHSGCRLCDMLDMERSAGARIVLERSGLVCLCPFSSRTPYELLVAPVECEADGFASACLGDALALAAEGMRRLHATAGRAPLNAWLHTAPFGHEAPHWHLAVLPRLAALAGLELGAGIYVNTLPPEEAAETLRSAA